MAQEPIGRIAAIIFENPQKQILLYLRDDKPSIPFPAHWDLFGGHVEEDETPEEALVREIKEELDIDLAPSDFHFWKTFECLKGDAKPNIKHVYSGKIDVPENELTLHEGQYPKYFPREELPNLKFANILGKIVQEYVEEHS